MAKTWNVSLPITGVLLIDVECDGDADDAIEAALNSELTVDMIESWEAHKQICTGNVLHAEQNSADAYCGEED